VGLELRLAWRNVWRNGRRTALTVAATVFAVFLVVVFVAMADGVHEKMIEDSVRIHSGHVQVAGQGYLEDRTLEQFVVLDAELERAVAATPGVTGYAPRLNAFALLSKGEATKGVVLFGVDPAREGSVSTLPTRIEEGRFLPDDVERPIVLGAALARNLGAAIGDRLLVYSIAYTFENSYELFEVSGTIRLPEPTLERNLALIRLDDAQAFFAYGDRVSEVALLLDDARAVPAATSALRQALATGSEAERVEVNTWNQVMPELEQFIFIDDAGMYIMLAILVIVVAFGILNTILMSVLERTRELGVMLALGLRPAAIFRLVYFESMMLAAVGLLLGLALAIPLVLYMTGHPIPLEGSMGDASALIGIEPVMTFVLRASNPVGSTVTILVVAALAAFYPAVKASRARPIDALRSL
jgi:putative ABC transport system permease protein